MEQGPLFVTGGSASHAPGPVFQHFAGTLALGSVTDETADRRLTALVVQDRQAVVTCHEPVHVDGRPVGHVTSAAYGCTIGAPIAHARLPAGNVTPDTTADIEYFGARAPALTTAEPLLDPEMSRIRR